MFGYRVVSFLHLQYHLKIKTMAQLKFNSSHLVISFLMILSTQLIGQESQIAMDNMSRIYEIDSELEKKLQLFKTYKGFKKALLFQVSTTTAVLEISYQPNQVLLKERKPLSSQELKEFRTNVSYSIRNNAPESIVNQEGGSRFLINNAFLALTFYGAATPAIVAPTEAKTSLGLYMLTSGAGFFVPYLLTKGKQITDGAATLSFYGQSRGMVHGLVAPLLFTSNPNFRGTVGTSLGFSVLEGCVGFLWADNAKMTHGKTVSLGVYGDFGMGIGLAATHFSGLYELNDDVITARSIASGILGGTVLGMSTGLLLNKNTNYTKGDALALRTSGLIGASIPTTLLFMAKESAEIEGKHYSLAASLGAAAGLAFGHALAKKNELTTTQGVMIQLGSLAGGAVGMGVSYLGTDNSRAIVAGGTIGALLSYGLLTTSFANRKSPEKEQGISFNFSLNPNALLAFSKQTNISSKTPTFFNANLTF